MLGRSRYGWIETTNERVFPWYQPVSSQHPSLGTSTPVKIAQPSKALLAGGTEQMTLHH
jgi:hypothetical protein